MVVHGKRLRKLFLDEPFSDKFATQVFGAMILAPVAELGILDAAEPYAARLLQPLVARRSGFQHAKRSRFPSASTDVRRLVSKFLTPFACHDAKLARRKLTTAAHVGNVSKSLKRSLALATFVSREPKKSTTA